jgi:hypothetical protein
MSGSFLPEPFWLVSTTKFTRASEPALLWNQLRLESPTKGERKARLMIGQFAFINFFQTGTLHKQLDLLSTHHSDVVGR